MPGYAALAHLEPTPVSPIFGALDAKEVQILRCRELDELLFAALLGQRHPRDTLTTPAERMTALKPYLVSECVLLAATALWVHVGGTPPLRLTLAVPAAERSRWKGHSVHRLQLTAEDIVKIACQDCATLARAAIDVARTAEPLGAVEAILQARAAGISWTELRQALPRCRGAGAVGRPRVSRIIDALMAAPD